MKAVLKYAIVVAAGLLLAGCGYKVNYSLSGASIPPDAKTFSVAYFPNNAPMVAPILSSTLTDALRDKFTRQTRLTQVDEGGDFAFEGEITGYTSTTASVSGSSETALLNRPLPSMCVLPTPWTRVCRGKNHFPLSKISILRGC